MFLTKNRENQKFQKNNKNNKTKLKNDKIISLLHFNCFFEYPANIRMLPGYSSSIFVYIIKIPNFERSCIIEHGFSEYN